MQIVTILGIAVALAMDAFAVAIATGVCLQQVSARQTFRLSWHFGLFQALMPVIGWAIGASIEKYVAAYGHWVAFVMLAVVGSNMLREALKTDDEQEEACSVRKDNTRGMTMVMLSVATSIDALAAGLSISMLRLPILYPAIIIGIVAGLFTILGLHLGQRISRLSRISTWAEIMGAVVLWLIGLNILWEKGSFDAIL